MGPTQKSMTTVTAQPIRKPTVAKACTHSRLIDDVLTEGGERTGKARCLECQAVVDDPYRGMK